MRDRTEGAIRRQPGNASHRDRCDRILTDIELLDTDVSELDLERAAVPQPSEKIAIPDTEYDREFWRDVDDEGVGGHRY